MAESAGPIPVNAWAVLTEDGFSTYVFVQLADDSPPLTETPLHTNFVVKANEVQQNTASLLQMSPLVYRVLLSETVLSGTDVITVGHEYGGDPRIEDALGNPIDDFADQPVTNYIGRRRYLWQHGRTGLVYHLVTTVA